jgi:hypothetical protein
VQPVLPIQDRADGEEHGRRAAQAGRGRNHEHRRYLVPRRLQNGNQSASS